MKKKNQNFAISRAFLLSNEVNCHTCVRASQIVVGPTMIIWQRALFPIHLTPKKEIFQFSKYFGGGPHSSKALQIVSQVAAHKLSSSLLVFG